MSEPITSEEIGQFVKSNGVLVKVYADFSNLAAECSRDMFVGIPSENSFGIEIEYQGQIYPIFINKEGEHYILMTAIADTTKKS